MSTTVETDDQLSLMQDRTLVMGVLGVGTFIVGLLFVITSAVWFLSYSCGSPAKAIWRVLSTGFLVVVTVILYFAPHSNRYEDNSYESAV